MMCQKLYEAGKSILEMGYYKNENARSGDYQPGHEDAVADVLTGHGFQGFEQKDFPNLKRGHLKTWWNNGFGNQLDDVLADMPNGSYILQPGGTQSFPDVLVKDFNGRMVAIECKSGKGTHPMWNDSTPKHGAAYIMSSARTGASTLFMGEDVFTKEEADVIEKFNQKFEELKQECFAELSQVNNFNRGWLYSHRRQFFQQGGKTKTNYFTHPDKESCEKNVLEFFAL
jgi:hypothetical protein